MLLPPLLTISPQLEDSHIARLRKNGVKFLDQSLGQGKKRRQHFWVRRETTPPCTARDWRWSRATTNRDCCMVSFNSRWCNSTSAMGLKYLISKITLLLLKWGVLLNPYLFCVADKDKCLQQLTYQLGWWFELHSITWHNYDEKRFVKHIFLGQYCPFKRQLFG